MKLGRVIAFIPLAVVAATACPPLPCDQAACVDAGVGDEGEGEGNAAEGEGEGAIGEGEGEGVIGEGEGEGEGGEGEGEGEGFLPTCFDAGGWCWETAVAPTQTPSSVFAASSTDVWIGVVDGGVLHYDGSSFAPVRVDVAGRSAGVERMWGSASNDIYGAGHDLLHFDGSSWAPAATDLFLHDVTGTASNDVWAVGDAGRVAHFDGTSITNDTIVGAGNLLAVASRAVDDVFAADENGLYRFHNGGWSPFSTRAANIQNPPTMIAADANLVVAQFFFERVTSLDGFQSVVVDDVGTTSLALDATHAWAIGRGVEVADRATNPLAFALTSQSPPFLTSSARTGLDGNVWVAGSSFNETNNTPDGLHVLRGNAQGTLDELAYAPVTANVGRDLLAYDVADGAHAISGDLMRGSDGAWQPLTNTPPTGGRFIATADDDVWASGLAGLSHFDGATWSPLVGAPSGFFPGAPCAGAANDLFTFGDSIAHYDGASWSTTKPASYPGGAATSFCTSPREAFFVPGNGLVRVDVDVNGGTSMTVVGLTDEVGFFQASAVQNEAWLNLPQGTVHVDDTGFVVDPNPRDSQNRPRQPFLVTGASPTDFWRDSFAGLVHVVNGIESLVAPADPPRGAYNSGAAFPDTLVLFASDGAVVTVTSMTSSETASVNAANDFHFFSAVSPTEAYCLNDAGDVFRFDGNTWLPWLTGQGVTSLSAVGPDDVWVVAAMTSPAGPSFVAERVVAGVVDSLSAVLGAGIGGQIVGVDDDIAYVLDGENRAIFRYDGVAWLGVFVTFQIANSPIVRVGDEAVVAFSSDRVPFGLVRVNGNGVFEIPNVRRAIAMKVDESAGAATGDRVALGDDGRGYRIDAAGKTTFLTTAETSSFFEHAVAIVDDIAAHPCVSAVELSSGAMVDVDTTFPVCAIATATTPSGHQFIVGANGAVVHRAP